MKNWRFFREVLRREVIKNKGIYRCFTKNPLWKTSRKKCQFFIEKRELLMPKFKDWRKRYRLSMMRLGSFG